MKNPYKALLDLLPSHPLQVGEVVDYDAGVATIELPGGAVVQARGPADIGDHVFFSGNTIEGPAPSLPFVSIEV